jgi:hypothetical protein
VAPQGGGDEGQCPGLLRLAPHARAGHGSLRREHVLLAAVETRASGLWTALGSPPTLPREGMHLTVAAERAEIAG